jgi:hypothetical protein
MASSGMLRRVALVKTDVSEEFSASAQVFLCSVCRLLVTATLFLVKRFLSSDDGGAKFLRNVGSYKSHTA